MATRLLTNADRDIAITRMNDVLDELRGDFGPVDAYTLAKLQPYIDGGQKAAILYLLAGVPRGVLLAANTPDGWQIVLIVTDKTMTMAQRITAARDLIRDGAGRLPPNAIIWGIVKAGGRLDTLLSARPFTRAVYDAEYTTQDVAVGGGLTTTRMVVTQEKLIKFSATAAMVLASI